MSHIIEYTNWFDVKEYTSVVLTVKTENGSYFQDNRPFTLIWGKGDADHPPFDANLTGSEEDDHEKDILCSDQCPSMKANETLTVEFPVRTRWVLLKKERDVANNFAEVSWPMFKKAPTALSIRDDTNVTEIASIVVDESPQINYIDNGADHTISESAINLATLALTPGAKTFTVTVTPEAGTDWSANFGDKGYANNLSYPIMLTGGNTFTDISTNDNIVLQIHNESDPTQIYYYDIYTNSMNEDEHSNTRYTISRFHPYTENAIKVALTDSSGLLISTTNHNDVPNALFVHMSNSGGDSVDTLGKESDSRNLTRKVLATSVMDSSNIAIASTGLATAIVGDHDQAPRGNALVTAFTDSDTSLQAATEPIAFGGKAGAPGDKTVTKDGNGRAFYYALSDHFGTPFTSIDTCVYHNDKLGNDISYNAMYVHLTDVKGKSISDGNELPIIMKSQTTSKTKKSFDSPVESSMTMVNSDLSNTSFKVHSLGIANELPVTVWVKVYDVSTGKIDENSTDEFTSYKGDIVYNVPVMPGDYRDLNMSQGVGFENGLYMRINDSYEYDNSYYPIDKDNAGKVYITGTYSTQN